MQLVARIRRSAGLSVVSAGLYAALVAPAAAQAPVFVLRVGDSVGGTDTVSRLGACVVNSSGQWVAQIRTTSTNVAADEMMIRDGVPLVTEGSALTAPAGASIDGFGPFDLDDSGNLFQVYYLAGTSGVGDDSGLFRNGTPLLLEGSTSGAPQFGAGTVYRGFLSVKSNPSGTRLAVIAGVDDPTVPGPLEIALIRVDLSGGAVTGETVVAREGDIPAGQTRTITGLGTGLHQLAINEPGDILYFVDLAGNPATDGVIYLNGTVVAQEGGPSPDPARTYERLASRALDINDPGDILFQADLDLTTNDDAVLVLADSIYAREGTRPIPSPLANRNLQDFGPPSSPVAVDNGGSVAYAGHAAPTFTFLVALDQLIAYSIFGTVDGETVTEIMTGAGRYAASPSNGWVLFRVRTGATQGVLESIALFPGPGQGPVDAPAVAAADGPGLRVFPNPAPATVQIRFALDRDAPVSLRVFDIAGRLVSTLADRQWPAGQHALAWSATDGSGRRVAPGTYFLRLRIGDRAQDARVTVVE